MFTDFWKIDLGTTLAILLPIVGSVSLGVYRICKRLYKIEEQVGDLLVEQVGRAALQDTRHTENQDRFDRMERILMGDRRPGR